MHKPIIQGSVAWQDLYDQGYVVVKKDEYMSHWPTQGWQPIETAPKDGTLILGWDKDFDCMIVEWSYDRWRCSHDGEDMYTPEPTHWMQLPEPPK